MSRIDTLKNQFKEFNYTIIDLLTEIDGTESHKYLQFLCKVVKNKISNSNDSKYHEDVIQTLKKYGIESDNSFSVDYIKMCLLDRFLDVTDIKIFNQFKSYMENGLIVEKDITKYSTFSDISNAVSLAELKILEKDYETRVFKEFEDENWLIVRPLSFSSSCKYGSATKWCTTFTNDKQYFFKYFYKSILAYIINKNNGYKVAMHGSIDSDGSVYDLSFWNSADSRMDFLEVDVDDYLIRHIKKILKSKISNCSFVTKSELSEIALECNSLFRLTGDYNLSRNNFEPVPLDYRNEEPQLMRG